MTTSVAVSVGSGAARDGPMHRLSVATVTPAIAAMSLRAGPVLGSTPERSEGKGRCSLGEIAIMEMSNTDRAKR